MHQKTCLVAENLNGGVDALLAGRQFPVDDKDDTRLSKESHKQGHHLPRLILLFQVKRNTIVFSACAMYKEKQCIFRHRVLVLFDSVSTFTATTAASFSKNLYTLVSVMMMVMIMLTSNYCDCVTLKNPV